MPPEPRSVPLGSATKANSLDLTSCLLPLRPAVSSSVPCLSSVSFLFVLFHMSLICVVCRQLSTCAGVSYTHTHTRCVFSVTCVNAFVGLSQCVRASAYCCVCVRARVCVHVRVQERACMRYRSVLRQRVGACTQALCCVCACYVWSCVVLCMCQYLSQYMHRYWHLHGAEHGTSCRLKFAKTAPQLVSCPWRMMSAEACTILEGPKV